MVCRNNQWFEKPYLRETLNPWIEISFRAMREKFRVCVTCWTQNEYDLLIQNAKELQKELASFIDYLERKRKSE
jgi:hypothetical protein